MWSTDWRDRIGNEIQSLAFAGISEYLSSVPAEPYAEVAARLGQVAPIQVIAIQFREARLTGSVREAAKDCLCRNLVEQLPGGWGIGERSDWQCVKALSSWSSEIEITGECEHLSPILLAIGKTLREIPPPEGWIPKGPNDPFIEFVFNSKWPINA